MCIHNEIWKVKGKINVGYISMLYISFCYFIKVVWLVKRDQTSATGVVIGLTMSIPID